MHYENCYFCSVFRSNEPKLIKTKRIKHAIRAHRYNVRWIGATVLNYYAVHNACMGWLVHFPLLHSTRKLSLISTAVVDVAVSVTFTCRSLLLLLLIFFLYRFFSLLLFCHVEFCIDNIVHYALINVSRFVVFLFNSVPIGWLAFCMWVCRMSTASGNISGFTQINRSRRFFGKYALEPFGHSGSE